MPGEFARVLREGIEEHVGLTQREGPGAYLLSPDRVTEADAVEPCVARLATAEIHPPDTGPGVGRAAAASRTAPLATRLGAALDQADISTRRAARTAVLRAVAVGYGGVIDLEAAAIEGGREIAVRLDEPEAVWSRWVVALNDSPVVKRVHRQSLGVLHQLGAHALLEPLRAGRMAPRFGSRRLGHLASWYVEAGLSLRALQTDLFAEAAEAPADAVDRWPFDALPESLPA